MMSLEKMQDWADSQSEVTSTELPWFAVFPIDAGPTSKDVNDDKSDVMYF
jgi:hypothetical protein